MSKLRAYFSWWRVGAIFVFLSGVATYFAGSWYWANVCATEGCTSYFMGAYLAPIRAAGLVIAVATAPFLGVPTRYFKAWLLWVFVPATAFTLWSVLSIDPNQSHSFLMSLTREQAVENLLWVWLTVTLVFIMVRHYRFLNKKTKRDQ